MQNHFDHKIKTILHVLHARGFILRGIRQGIRLKLESGVDVDIYTLKFDADKLRARLKLNMENRDERDRVLKEVILTLEDALHGTAVMEAFKFSRCILNEYYYYARIFMVDKQFAASPGAERTELLVSSRKAAETNEVNVEEKSDLKKVVDIFESVDAKMFRNALDGLGLPRTSILRMALTRIFRSAIEADELREAIKEESARITDPADRGDLEKIMNTNYVEFLDPVIRMLHQSVFGETDNELNNGIDAEILATDFS